MFLITDIFLFMRYTQMGLVNFNKQTYVNTCIFFIYIQRTYLQNVIGKIN